MLEGSPARPGGCKRQKLFESVGRQNGGCRHVHLVTLQAEHAHEQEFGIHGRLTASSLPEHPGGGAESIFHSHAGWCPPDVRSAMSLSCS